MKRPKKMSNSTMILIKLARNYLEKRANRKAL